MSRALAAVATFGACAAAYAAVVVWLTWPLAARIDRDLPDAHGACRFDLPAIAWILATESRNAVRAPTAPLAGTAFHPEPEPLAYGPLALGALPLFAPVFLATGNPALAANVLFLGGIALTAASLHLAARHWTGSHLAGFLAAWALLTDRWLLWEFVPTAPFYGVLLWVPPIAVLAARPRPGAAWTVALAGLVLLQGMVDQVYLAAAVVAPLAALAALRLVRPATRHDGLRLGGATALGAALLAPLYVPYLRLRAANPSLAGQTVWRGSEDPVPLGRVLYGHQSPTSIAPAIAALVAVGLALHVVRGRRGAAATPRGAWATCAALVLVAGALALPRAVAVAGVTLEPPWYAWLPALRHLRGTERMGAVALVGLALAAGLALAECAGAIAAGLRRRSGAASARGGAPRRAAAALAIAVATLAFVQSQRGFGRPAFGRKPLPDRYPTLAAIAADDPVVRALRAGTGPLLELPLGPFDILPPFHARAMYRSIFHERPLLNGYSSYFPQGFRERMALASRLPDPAALAELRRDTGLAQVLVQAAEITDPASRAAWLELARRGGGAGLALVAREGDTLLFDLREPT